MKNPESTESTKAAKKPSLGELQSERKSEFEKSSIQKNNDGTSSICLAAAESKADALPPGNLTREVIKYLIAGEHTSHKKPAALKEMAMYMQENGFIRLPAEDYDKAIRRIQKQVIARSRKEKHFIGTSGDGVYLIGSLADAEETLKWYEKRTASQNGHVKNLKELMNLK